MVSAFTRNPYAGNPTWVVAGAELREEQRILTRLAKKLNPISDTVFVFPDGNSVDVSLRFFTHSQEREFSGHGTVAAYFGIENSDFFPLVEPITLVKQRTKTGTQHLELRVENNRVVRVTVSLPYPEYDARLIDVKQVAKALTLPVQDILKNASPVGIVHLSGKSNLIVPVKSFQILSQLEPDFHYMESLCDRLAINGIVVWCFETFGKESSAHIRYFSPGIGVNEDPVSGTASASLGCYLVHNKIHPKSEMTRFVVEQGYSVKSPGIVYVHVYTHGDKIMKVTFGGQAVVTFEGQISSQHVRS
jgi:PhzF family phenazine biosynthesis protein